MLNMYKEPQMCKKSSFDMKDKANSKDEFNRM